MVRIGQLRQISNEKITMSYPQVNRRRWRASKCSWYSRTSRCEKRKTTLSRRYRTMAVSAMAMASIRRGDVLMHRGGSSYPLKIRNGFILIITSSTKCISKVSKWSKMMEARSWILIIIWLRRRTSRTSSWTWRGLSNTWNTSNAKTSKIV